MISIAPEHSTASTVAGMPKVLGHKTSKSACSGRHEGKNEYVSEDPPQWVFYDTRAEKVCWGLGWVYGVVLTRGETTVVQSSTEPIF